ncbi:MAG: PilZ domain-containing protein [Armatimonadetes bacterium]|nr:PilZ domain-containing protein [Armatimonadota bacterium]
MPVRTPPPAPETGSARADSAPTRPAKPRHPRSEPSGGPWRGNSSGPHQTPVPGRLQDGYISATGSRVLLATGLPAGTRVRLLCQLGTGRFLWAGGEVVWVRENGGGAIAGVRFERPSALINHLAA